jgi:hypothetical protein
LRRGCPYSLSRVTMCQSSYGTFTFLFQRFSVSKDSRSTSLPNTSWNQLKCSTLRWRKAFQR